MGGTTAATGAPAVRRARFRLEHPLLVQIVRYALLGAAGTGANAVVFLILRSWLDAVPANLIALVLSTALSTELNRRFTFGGAEVHRWRNTVQNGGTVLFYAFYSSAVLLLLGLFVESPSPALESATVAAASLLGGTVRFLVLRQWVFADDQPEDDVTKDQTAATRS
ncbi:GtrA family protein [Pseudonocardia lacus]|uniref:GtrA family protein n=1 Tax=Pseudonocardia lacus TaxID=2835865 RepID=UPI001BDD9869|nr:GtrA family protein [Pseudonocardia lacus]